jgi:predicted ATP-grasp superfamily ATP-dependent carboligase
MPIPVLILDGNQRSALATVRSLGKAGCVVTVAERFQPCLAASSRYCSDALVYPDPALRPAEFSRWLSDLAHSRTGHVLMPMSDLTVPLTLENSAVLASMRTALPSPGAYHDASDKYRLFEIARELGVPVPDTLLVNLRMLDSPQLADFPLPAVIKPRQSVRRTNHSARKRTTRYATSRTELIETLRSMLEDEEDSCLVQQHIAGAGAGVFALYDRGMPRFFFAHRRIREKPPSGGVSVLCESMPLDPASTESARRILDALKWHGVAMVEFKVDDDGTPWLIEINARFWGSLQLAVDSGADFPKLVCDLATDNALQVPASYATGRKLRWLLGDLDNLYATIRHRRYSPSLSHKARAAFRFLVPWQRGMRYEFLRASDPYPAVFALREYVSDLVAPASGETVHVAGHP